MRINLLRDTIIVLVTIAGAMSCDNTSKFGKEGWTRWNDMFPPEARKEMLNDLLTNYKVVDISYRELVTLLGEPNDRYDSIAKYEIEIDYGSDTDPIYTKDLVFVIDKDSVVKSYRIKEWHTESEP